PEGPLGDATQMDSFVAEHGGAFHRGFARTPARLVTRGGMPSSLPIRSPSSSPLLYGGPRTFILQNIIFRASSATVSSKRLSPARISNWLKAVSHSEAGKPAMLLTIFRTAFLSSRNRARIAMI